MSCVTILLFNACKSPDQTSKHKVRWAVSLVIADSHLSLPKSLCEAMYGLRYFITPEGKKYHYTDVTDTNRRIMEKTESSGHGYNTHISNIILIFITMVSNVRIDRNPLKCFADGSHQHLRAVQLRFPSFLP